VSELLRALGALSERPGRDVWRIARTLELPGEPDPEGWTALFARELLPYASIYLGAEGMIGGEARDRVAGFWRALGLAPPAEPDHLAALLGLAATLSEAEHAERDRARAVLLRRARQALLAEHLVSWLPVYLDRALELGSAFYRGWARLLREAVDAAAGSPGRDTSSPLAHREAPTLAPPDEVGLDTFLGQLLAPARSGLVITHSDLARAAGELGLGLRRGERRRALRALVEQDAERTLAWLACTATERSERLAGFWHMRLTASAALLSECAAAASAHVAVP
jgi:nitrate reductase assembly molybdenum cofactor insertion protein NarJ